MQLKVSLLWNSKHTKRNVKLFTGLGVSVLRFAYQMTVQALLFHFPKRSTTSKTKRQAVFSIAISILKEQKTHRWMTPKNRSAPIDNRPAWLWDYQTLLGFTTIPPPLVCTGKTNTTTAYFSSQQLLLFVFRTAMVRLDCCSTLQFQPSYARTLPFCA